MVARRSRWRRRAAAGRGAGSRAGPTPAPPRRSARRPGRPASASAQPGLVHGQHPRDRRLLEHELRDHHRPRRWRRARARAGRARGRRTSRARGSCEVARSAAPACSSGAAWRPRARCRSASHRDRASSLASVDPVPSTRPRGRCRRGSTGPAAARAAGRRARAGRSASQRRLLGRRSDAAQPARPQRAGRRRGADAGDPTASTPTAAAHGRHRHDGAGDREGAPTSRQPTRRRVAGRARRAPAPTDDVAVAADGHDAVAGRRRPDHARAAHPSHRPAPGRSSPDTSTVADHLRQRRHLDAAGVPAPSIPRRTWSSRSRRRPPASASLERHALRRDCSAATAWADARLSTTSAAALGGEPSTCSSSRRRRRRASKPPSAGSRRADARRPTSRQRSASDACESSPTAGCEPHRRPAGTRHGVTQPRRGATSRRSTRPRRQT